MKPVLTVLLLHLISYTSAQEILFKKDMKLRKALLENREAYAVVNPHDGNVSLFLIDNHKIRAHHFNQNIEPLDTLEAARPTGYSNLLGNTFTEGKYNLFFDSNSHQSFHIISFDFVKKTINEKAIALPLKKEKYAGSVSYKGKLYFFTIVKSTSKLNLYIFDDLLNYEIKAYDFKDERFANSKYEYTLFDVLHNNSAVFIDNEVPNPIDIVATSNKLYSYEDKIVLTLDNQLTRTAVITIDLATLKSDLVFYDQGNIEYGETTSRESNSYIYNNHLYQINICHWP
jgi:hypothetical protein